MHYFNEWKHRLCFHYQLLKNVHRIYYFYEQPFFLGLMFCSLDRLVCFFACSCVLSTWLILCFLIFSFQNCQSHFNCFHLSIKYSARPSPFSLFSIPAQDPLYLHFMTFFLSRSRLFQWEASSWELAIWFYFCFIFALLLKAIDLF